MPKFMINDSEIVIGDFLRVDGTKKMEGILTLNNTNENPLGLRDVATDTSIYWGCTGEGKGSCLRMNGPDKSAYTGVCGFWSYDGTTRRDFNLYPKNTAQYTSGALQFGNTFAARAAQSIKGPVYYSKNGYLSQITPLYLHRIKGVGSTETEYNYCFEILTNESSAQTTTAGIAKMLYDRGYTSVNKMVVGSGGYYYSNSRLWFARGYCSPDGKTLKLQVNSNSSLNDVVSATWKDKVIRVR